MKNEDIGKQLYDFIAQFGTNGGIDLADCAVGAYCAQTDVESANFLNTVEKKIPEPLKKIPAEIKVIKEKSNTWYGYKIGLDVDNKVQTYKNAPIAKIYNIWDYGTADGKTPRTRFWSSPLVKLKGKYNRATDRFYNILDKRFQGYYKKATNTGGTVLDKIQSYENNKEDYLTNDEKTSILKLEKGIKIGGK